MSKSVPKGTTPLPLIAPKKILGLQAEGTSYDEIPLSDLLPLKIAPP
jgi:hypothetical protein